MSTIIKHLKNNNGDANVSKALHIAIVFVVGAILLIMMTSSFQGPIHDWFGTRMDDWFNGNKPNTGLWWNGQRIPALPETEYGNWMLVEDNGQIALMSFETPEFFADTAQGTVGLRNDVYCELYILEGNSWVYGGKGLESAGSGSSNGVIFAGLHEFHVISSNFDILDEKGNVYQKKESLFPMYD